jgi:hypothetical protein
MADNNKKKTNKSLRRGRVSSGKSAEAKSRRFVRHVLKKARQGRFRPVVKKDSAKISEGQVVIYNTRHTLDEDQAKTWLRERGYRVDL